jgi:hypothetical protein
MPKPNANDYFNVSSCDFLRQKAGKIPHAADGLFDILGVKELARPAHVRGHVGQRHVPGGLRTGVAHDAEG